MVDQENGGLAVSYEDSHLDPATKAAVAKEIQSIISSEMDKIIEEEK